MGSMGQVTKASLINDMREWLKSIYLFTSFEDKTTTEVLHWFSNHVSHFSPNTTLIMEKQALEIWANYCLLEQV